MKKILLCIMIALFLLSGCSQEDNSEENNLCADYATQIAVSYLNNTIGYDSSAKYELVSYIKPDQSSFPKVYHLTENGKTIAYFELKLMDYVGQSIWSFPYKDRYIGISGGYDLIPKNIDEYTVRTKTVNINNELYLESVKTVNLTDSYHKTDESKFDLIKERICVGFIPEDDKNGTVITVLEHLNIINLGFNPDTKEICSYADDYDVYPVITENGRISLLAVNWKNQESGFKEFKEPEYDWEQDLLNNKPFVLVPSTKYNYIRISPYADTSITVPVIARKAYSKLKELASKQESYSKLFSFEYNTPSE